MDFERRTLKTAGFLWVLATSAMTDSAWAVSLLKIKDVSTTDTDIGFLRELSRQPSVIWNASTEWDSRAWCIVGIPEKERRLLRMGFECYTSWEKVISQRGDRCYRIGLIWRTTSYQDTHSTIRSRGHGTFIWILHGIQWTNSQCITQNCKRVYPASSEWRTPKVKCRGVPEGSKPP